MHVKSRKHGPNGLSRITPSGWQPSGNLLHHNYNDKYDGEPLLFRMGKGETGTPFNFEDFKHEIDSRSGYMAAILDQALSMDNFVDDIQQASDLD